LLAAHQRAADYCTARVRFGRFSLAVEIAVLLALTLGGSLQVLHEFWSPRSAGLWYGVALIFSVAAVSIVVDLPMSLYTQRPRTAFWFQPHDPAPVPA
jgi:STE24 endopeptidase